MSTLLVHAGRKRFLFSWTAVLASSASCGGRVTDYGAGEPAQATGGASGGGPTVMPTGGTFPAGSGGAPLGSGGHPGSGGIDSQLGGAAPIDLCPVGISIPPPMELIPVEYSLQPPLQMARGGGEIPIRASFAGIHRRLLLEDDGIAGVTRFGLTFISDTEVDFFFEPRDEFRMIWHTESPDGKVFDRLVLQRKCPGGINRELVFNYSYADGILRLTTKWKTVGYEEEWIYQEVER